MASASLQPPAGPDPRDILSSLGEVVYSWDLGSDELQWGPNVADVLKIGDEGDLISGARFAERIAAESPSSRFEAITRSGEIDHGAGVRYQVQYALLPATRGQPHVQVEDTGRWFADVDGRPARAHGVLRVVTARYQADRKAALATQFDPLTGTLNRAHLVDCTNRMFADAGRKRGSFGLLLASIEGLLLINRNCGYDVADELIAGVAQRLRGEMRTTDVISRYAGNKFALLLDSCDADQMAAAARRFLEAVGSKPIETKSGPLLASIRIGGLIAPRYARSHQALFQHAEEALDAARAQGGRRFVAYEPSMVRDEARMRTMRTADQIVSALNDRRIEIALEPVVSAKTHQPVFHEALLRLRLDDGTLVSPTTVVPAAEKAGLVQMLDHRVLELALAQLAADPALVLSVNMSGASAHDPEWPARARAAFHMHPGTAARLIIEITETCAINDLEATRNVINVMKEMGLRVAMDDFGSGHTSFRNLRSLAFDFLKIDGAFVQNLARSADDRFFVRTLVDLSRHLQIPMVAEWVEDEETANVLASWGVDYFQGQLFGRAVAVDSPQAPRRSATA